MKLLYYLLTTIISGIFIFTVNSPSVQNKIPFLKKIRVKPKGYIFHHSLFGIILFIVGFFIPSKYGIFISSIGLGTYIAHIIEEVYYCKKRFLKAIFVFITKEIDID